MDQAVLGVAAKPLPRGFPPRGQAGNWLSLARTDPLPVQTSSDYRWEGSLQAAGETQLGYSQGVCISGMRARAAPQ